MDTFGFDADFTLYRGTEAFRRWYATKQVPALLKQKTKHTPLTNRISEKFDTLLQRFLEMGREIKESRDPRLDLIDATQRYQSIHRHPSISRVLYQDFYLLPQFGKTLLGYIVQKAKIGEDTSLP